MPARSFRLNFFMRNDNSRKAFCLFNSSLIMRSHKGNRFVSFHKLFFSGVVGGSREHSLARSLGERSSSTIREECFQVRESGEEERNILRKYFRNVSNVIIVPDSEPGPFVRLNWTQNASLNAAKLLAGLSSKLNLI
jgi:hypothetical protein